MAQEPRPRPDEPRREAVGQRVYRLEQEERQRPVAAAELTQNAREQREEEAVWVRVVNPVIPNHRVLLPLRDFAGGVDVWVLPVTDLLPPSIDVAENVRRVEGVDEEGREAEDRCEYDDLADGARVVGSFEARVACAEQRQEREHAEPREQLLRRARARLRAADVKEKREYVDAGRERPDRRET